MLLSQVQQSLSNQVCYLVIRTELWNCGISRTDTCISYLISISTETVNVIIVTAHNITTQQNIIWNCNISLILLEEFLYNQLYTGH